MSCKFEAQPPPLQLSPVPPVLLHVAALTSPEKHCRSAAAGRSHNCGTVHPLPRSWPRRLGVLLHLTPTAPLPHSHNLFNSPCAVGPAHQVLDRMPTSRPRAQHLLDAMPFRVLLDGAPRRGPFRQGLSATVMRACGQVGRHARHLHSDAPALG
jgi:hypothetical protein